jgi:type VI secretion system secreted protein VgrG
MSSDPASLAAMYEIQAGAYAPGDLNVLSFEGREEMNGLYSFEVLLWGKEIDEGNFETTVLGRPAVLSMHLAADANRHVRGIVSSVVFEGRREGGRRAFRVTIVPRLWLLQKRVNSRIFQDLTAQQIVDALLEEHGIKRAWNLLVKYPIRQYCVQYQETDYHFITRILAEEGVFFCFEQPDGEPGDDVTESLSFGDNVHSYPAIAGDAALIYRHQQGEGSMHAAEPHVLDFRARSRVESSAVAMRDYDFRRPRLDLRSSAANADAPIPLEVYDHHGEYEETDADANNAGVYLEQLRAGAREVHGLSMCRRLIPGHTFDLTEHEVDTLNASYVVTHVEHKGVTPEAAKGSLRVYENHFRGVPAEVPFRPARPARVLRQVSESAVVVGPEGQEIFTDPFGRVKVQFHWDREGKRDEQSSCWMRVMQPWAGTGWGFQFIPRIGMEVVVNFLGGDQDRPVVMGCLYNAQNPVPHALPGADARSGIRTNSTPGGGGSNEIAFEDRSGNEQLYIHAQRNLDEEVGNNRTAVVHGIRSETVDGGALSLVRAHRADTTVGDSSADIGGSRSAVIGGGDASKVASQRTTDVGASDTLRVAADLDVRVGGGRVERIGKTDDLLVEGDRSTVVQGGETRVVWKQARTILHGGALLNVSGGLSLSVGSTASPAAAEGQIAGDLSLKGGGTIDLSAAKSIRLKVGKTVITIGSDEVSIEADKITLKAKSVDAKSDKSTLSMADNVEIAGKTVKIYSADNAILELDKEAKLDGKTVKIKPGLSEEMKKADEREEQAKDLDKVEIHLFDRKGKPISNAPYEVKFFGYLDEGTSADGTVQIPSFPDVDRAHVRWGRPPAERENPKDTEKYEFEMDVFLIVDDPDSDESIRRKLHNLGHQGGELHEAIQKMQAALGSELTGLVDDVKSDAESRHDAVTPVDTSAKGAA